MARCGAFVARKSRFIAMRKRPLRERSPRHSNTAAGRGVRLICEIEQSSRRARWCCLLAHRCWRCGRIQPRPASHRPKLPRAHLKLASLSTAARRDIDYEALDARLQQLVAKPSMVGMAVGVVENGRITFLQGYGETLKDQAIRSPQTRCSAGRRCRKEWRRRWSPSSPSRARSTLTRRSPIMRQTSSCRTAMSTWRRSATCCRTALGSIATLFDNKLEEGQDPSFLRTQLATLNAICAPGTCWDYQNVAYDASSEMVVADYRPCRTSRRSSACCSTRSA